MDENFPTSQSGDTIDLRTPTRRQGELLDQVTADSPNAQMEVAFSDPHKLRKDIDSVVEEIGGVPKPGTPEFEAMSERMKAMRTPEEIAEAEAEQARQSPETN